jgi:hypothetical protein
MKQYITQELPPLPATEGRLIQYPGGKWEAHAQKALALSDTEIDALWAPDNLSVPQRSVRLSIARAVLAAANKKARMG